MITSTPSRPISRSGSPAKAFSASASSTSGTPARSTSAWTNARCAGRLSEARADGDHVGLEVEHAIDAPRSRRCRTASRRAASVMYSGAIAATIGRHDRGVATVTRPAPDRSAPMRREVRRAGPAERSGDDQHAAEVPLVRVGGARRHELAHPLAGQQLEVAALRARRTPAAGCRCRRSPDRRRASRPAERPAESSARRASPSSTPRSPRPRRRACRPRGRSADRSPRPARRAPLTSATTVSSSPLSWPRNPVPRMASTIRSHSETR